MKKKGGTKFCKDCKWYFYSSMFNKIYCTKETGEKKSPIMKSFRYADCFIDNKNNNCKYYEQKKSWLRCIFKSKLFVGTKIKETK